MSEPSTVSLRPHHGYQVWSTDWYGPDRDEKKQLRRHYKRFGKQAEMTPKQAQAAYNRWYSEEWTPKYGKGAESESLKPPAYTVKEMCNDYTKYAQTFYRKKNGDPTSMVNSVEVVMRIVTRKLGSMAAADLTPPVLATFRDGLLKPQKFKVIEALTVKTATNYLGTFKRCIKWAMEKGKIDPGTGAGMILVKNLQPGRCAARDKTPVGPVDWERVEKVLPILPANMAAMLLMQWHTGARPGEIRIMRPCDIDMSGDVWKYTPASHKTEHKGRKRMIPIGPQAQAILTPYLSRKTTDYCFSPMDELKKHPRLKRSPLYSTGSYLDFIHRACDKAEIERFHAHQTRHAWATRVAAAEGIEAAQDVLGHATINMTLVYVERSSKRAVDVARRVG